jgi:hypothetical protein
VSRQFQQLDQLSVQKHITDGKKGNQKVHLLRRRDFQYLHQEKRLQRKFEAQGTRRPLRDSINFAPPKINQERCASRRLTWIRYINMGSRQQQHQTSNPSGYLTDSHSQLPGRTNQEPGASECFPSLLVQYQLYDQQS